MNDEPLLKAGDVAARLNVPETWVYAAARSGDLPAVYVGRHVRFQRHEIEAFIASGGKPAGATSNLVEPASGDEPDK